MCVRYREWNQKKKKKQPNGINKLFSKKRNSKQTKHSILASTFQPQMKVDVFLSYTKTAIKKQAGSYVPFTGQ